MIAIEAQKGNVNAVTMGGVAKARFTMVCFFYAPYVCKRTGEIGQGKFTYNGPKIRKDYIFRGFKFASDLDALKHHLNQIHLKCERVLMYDNLFAGEDALICRIDKGTVAEGCKLGHYEHNVKLKISKHNL